MDKLEYKGYYGSIEFSKEDDCLFGMVLGMPNNLISYEGATTTDLYNDFKDAVDAYLDYCKRNGIKPRKGYESHGTSINSFIQDPIEKQLEVI